ncbi:carbonic anhydrase [Powellomyces hirtus]|uniref:Carbonic anhydrase n=1 Tax=Powellomyces hirtus TaxID=109895 RepID=A0A507EBU8_9FUNG|nr:carbonic anhydrase [Powellomyces hirtus]
MLGPARYLARATLPFLSPRTASFQPVGCCWRKLKHTRVVDNAGHSHPAELNEVVKGTTTKTIATLLENNREWAEAMVKERPGFFTQLAEQQSPDILWIGCSDSRVPANQLLKLLPGEVFVHRNIANIVPSTDLNSHSVLQYAVDALKVRHVIICGHYQCGGVGAALTNQQYGLVDYWIRSIKDLYKQNEKKLRHLSPTEQHDRMVELNVARSVDSVAYSTVVQNAWSRGQKVAVHGMVYRLADGRLKDLKMSVESLDDLKGVHRVAEHVDPDARQAQ